MKGKLLQAVKISHNEILEKGTEVDIIADFHGCLDYCVCKLSDNRHINIRSSMLEITDWSTYIDWEQRRWDAAIAAMQGMLSDPEINSGGETVAKACIEYADALIEEFKK